MKSAIQKMVDRLFAKAPKDTLTVAELSDRLLRGIKLDDMPRYVELPDGRKLDVTDPDDAAALKCIIRAGNRRMRRVKDAAKRG